MAVRVVLQISFIAHRYAFFLRNEVPFPLTIHERGELSGEDFDFLKASIAEDTKIIEQQLTALESERSTMENFSPRRNVN
jgi:hypothetical protein